MTEILVKSLKDGSNCTVTIQPDGETGWNLRVDRSGNLVGVTKARPCELPREKRQGGLTHALIVISGKVSIGLTKAEAEAMGRAIDHFAAQRVRVATAKRKEETAALSARLRDAAPGAETWTVSDPHSVPAVGATWRLDGLLVTTISTSGKYYREDGTSFGAADDSGWVYYAEVREATEDESAPVLAEEEAQLRRKHLRSRIESEIVAPAARPAADGEIPDLFALREVQFGEPLVHLRVDQTDGTVWVLHYNGADGDNWAYNNYRGYIATSAPLTAARTDLLAQLGLAK